ncbi:glycosyltransferase family 4 protein [Natronobeatus ordinarius]|uniref:glycosyltransferase family 4 protein n=1 Tax=Natronobeatus ordinarius TaxID=2963433 RepID=UPI0020CCD472|nr:glycosyltransferase family 4 protein [Natronobeatus ordinarius]
MNVLSLVTNRYAPFYVNQTVELESRGINIDHVNPRKQTEDHEEQQQISRSYVDYLPLFSRPIRKAFKEYDLVHANNGKTAPFALAQPHRPIVLTLWGSDLAGKYGSVTKRCAQFCDEVIVRNEEMCRELGRDAHVIPAGIDMEQFKPHPQLDAPRSVGWDPSKKHVLFPYPPSRPVKNYPLAERVVERVDEELPEKVCLQTVYGVDHDDVSTYMNAADALLLTSHREGSPNSVKEAMACNLPVVATDVGDVQERLCEVEPSFVCTTEDELVAALCEVLERNERSNGREHIRDLSIDQMGEQILDVYKHALE